MDGTPGRRPDLSRHRTWLRRTRRPAGGDLHHPRARGSRRRHRALWTEQLRRADLCRVLHRAHRAPQDGRAGPRNPEGKWSTCSPWPETVKAGPFTVGFLPISHSIPESSALVIDTPGGRVMHTGDFKLDGTPRWWASPSTPTLGPKWRSRACGAGLRQHQRVRPSGRSESDRRPPSPTWWRAPGMVVATTFASNVARVKTLAEAGERPAGRSAAGPRDAAHGRGRSRRPGVLTRFPATISPEEARPRSRART